MATFSVANNEHMIRSSVWTGQLKKNLEDELLAMRFVTMFDFPDGNTVNIPSLGQPDVFDYAEGAPVRYSGRDTGNLQFTINYYKQTGESITNKMMQDSFAASMIKASFVPDQHRALMKAIEADVLAVGPDGQTASNLNTINTGNHRFIGTGTNETFDIADLARARYALQMANVPMTNLVFVCHPSVEFKLATLANVLNLSNNPMWDGIVSDGSSTGMKFRFSVMGFDVYTSQNLKTVGAETINGLTTSSTAVANIAFSAAQGVNPFLFSMKQAPKVDSEYNKELQQEEYVTTCRYGVKLYRPENLVTIITDIDQVS